MKMTKKVFVGAMALLALVSTLSAKPKKAKKGKSTAKEITWMFWDKHGAYVAFEKLYKRRQDFTAVICSTDWLAFGVYEYAEKHGLSIPDDFSIIGFDDDYASSYIYPTLTTFHQDSERIADLSCEIMMNLLAGFPAPKMLRCEAKFIERKSVKSLL